MNTDETTAWLLLDTPRCSCLGNPPMYLCRCSNGCMEKKKKRRASKYTGRRFLCFNTQHILQPWQFYLYSKLAVLVNSFSVVNIPVWPLWLTTLCLWWITEQRTCGITRLPSLPAWKDMLRCEGFSEISKTLRLSETCQALWILILNTWLTI